MNTSKPTPGHWRVGDAGLTVFGPPNGQPSPVTVANTKNRANAALITAAVNACHAVNPDNPLAVAEAIPELARLLHETQLYLETALDMANAGQAQRRPSPGFLTRVSAVLAKLETQP